MACKYCEIIEGKKGVAKLYEDDRVVAFLAGQPATIGHIVVAPKKHLPILEALDDDDVEHAFKIANKVSVAVFEAIKSEGTNIMIHNGIEAGQEVPHFSINIITRKTGDGLMFDWAPKQLDEQEMATIELQLKEELDKAEIPAEVPKEAPVGKEEAEGAKEGEEKKETIQEGEKEENYLIKQLRRMP
jgi:histidine triad (HIT) family protein